MNTLKTIYEEMLTEGFTNLDKWQHHLTIYDRYLTNYTPDNEKFVIISLGENLDSAILFYRYFMQHGIDNTKFVHVHKENADTLALAEKGIFVEQGNYEDDNYLKDLMKRLGAADIVIDDTQYTNSQMMAFKALYTKVKPGGFLFVEDTHLNYRKDYRNSRIPFVEYLQTLYRQLDDWWNTPSQDKQFTLYKSLRDEQTYSWVSDFGKKTEGIHLHGGMIVLEKSLEPDFPWQKTKTWSINT